MSRVGEKNIRDNGYAQRARKISRDKKGSIRDNRYAASAREIRKEKKRRILKITAMREGQGR